MIAFFFLCVFFAMSHETSGLEKGGMAFETSTKYIRLHSATQALNTSERSIFTHILFIKQKLNNERRTEKEQNWIFFKPLLVTTLIWIYPIYNITAIHIWMRNYFIRKFYFNFIWINTHHLRECIMNTIFNALWWFVSYEYSQTEKRQNCFLLFSLFELSNWTI